MRLSAALARAGVACDVFTRSVDPALPEIVEVEPGFRLHHVAAGPLAPLPKGVLHNFVGEFTDAVETRLSKIAAEEVDAPEAIHANYWLSGVAGHALKHRLGLPLVSTFHTLDRVKAEASPEEVDPEDPDAERAEAEVIGCSDVVLASCEAEVSQFVVSPRNRHGSGSSPLATPPTTWSCSVPVSSIGRPSTSRTWPISSVGYWKVTPLTAATSSGTGWIPPSLN